MAAQHLPRDLVRPSSGYEEMTQKKKHRPSLVDIPTENNPKVAGMKNM